MGTTVVLVTHDARVAAFADREAMVRDGLVITHEKVGVARLMVRLGLQLTLRSGREALVRALMIAVAVAIGVTVLLAVFADYHAYRGNEQQGVLGMHTSGARAASPSSGSELWKYSENIYQGRFIEVLDVAALGPRRAGRARAWPSSPKPASTTLHRRWPAS